MHRATTNSANNINAPKTVLTKRDDQRYDELPAMDRHSLDDDECESDEDYDEWFWF